MKTKPLSEHFNTALGDLEIDPNNRMAYFGAFILGWSAHESELEKQLEDAHKLREKSTEEWVGLIEAERQKWAEAYHEARKEYVNLCNRIAGNNEMFPEPFFSQKGYCRFCGCYIENAMTDHAPDCIWAEAKLVTSHVPVEVKKEN